MPVERQAEGRAGRNGPLVHVDLAVPEIRWGIELDIHPEHRSLEGHAGDARRTRSLHSIGWEIEPVSEHDMADVNAVADQWRRCITTAGCSSTAIGVFPDETGSCRTLRWPETLGSGSGGGEKAVRGSTKSTPRNSATGWLVTVPATVLTPRAIAGSRRAASAAPWTATSWR